MIWESEPRVAVLRHAQTLHPLFMLNLGDVPRWAILREWRRYLDDVRTAWDRTTPRFHTPGRHCPEHPIFGRRREVFETHCGRSSFCIGVGEKWSFIVFDSPST